jgi:ribosomal protein S18 acetylase RimI-like enzyme
MRDIGDDELYRRGGATMLASWAEYARGSVAAALHHLPGVTAAVFTREPEGDVYNNALLAPGLHEAARVGAVDAMEGAYAEAGVGSFAAWALEDDSDMLQVLECRGYVLDTSTLAMGMALADPARPPVPSGVELGPATWAEYLEFDGLPARFLQAADHAALHVLVAREEGPILAAALAYDFEGDCGIYNVGTRETARRRGLGTAVTAAQVHAARDRGCTTASLQSTKMGEGVYRSIGFRPLRRILEYTPRRSDGRYARGAA